MKFLENSIIEVLKKAINKWGTRSQIIKYFEETSELQQLLAKYLLYNVNNDWKNITNQNLTMNIRSEIADTLLTLQSLAICFDIPLNVNKEKYISFQDDNINKPINLGDIPIHWNIRTFIVSKIKRLERKGVLK